MSMGGLFGAIFGALENGPPESLARTEQDGSIISTVDTPDMGPETAILDANGTHPVARYATVEEAKKGHEEWVAFINQGLRKVSKLGYGDMVGDEEITLSSSLCEEE